MRSWPKRLGAVAAAAAMASVAAISPAAAASGDITITGPGRGLVEYIDDGDIFTVCDTNGGDGNGVVLKIWYRPAVTIPGPGTFKVVKSQYDGDGGGCTTIGYDIENYGTFRFTLHWAGYEVARSRDFND